MRNECRERERSIRSRSIRHLSLARRRPRSRHSMIDRCRVEGSLLRWLDNASHRRPRFNRIASNVILRFGEDLLRRQLGWIAEEILVIQNRRKLLWHLYPLKNWDQHFALRRKREEQGEQRTTQNSSWNSNNSCTARTAEKLSSLYGSFPLE